ncbi:hypothetical protein LTS08_007315 [Lithohypha guttulata]|nr:hypothetical protein LTS08_007315 [Lithohypha guttulata]
MAQYNQGSQARINSARPMHTIASNTPYTQGNTIPAVPNATMFQRDHLGGGLGLGTNDYLNNSSQFNTVQLSDSQLYNSQFNNSRSNNNLFDNNLNNNYLNNNFLNNNQFSFLNTNNRQFNAQSNPQMNGFNPSVNTSQCNNFNRFNQPGQFIDQFNYIDNGVNQMNLGGQAGSYGPWSPANNAFNYINNHQYAPQPLIPYYHPRHNTVQATQPHYHQGFNTVQAPQPLQYAGIGPNSFNHVAYGGVPMRNTQNLPVFQQSPNMGALTMPMDIMQAQYNWNLINRQPPNSTGSSPQIPIDLTDDSGTTPGTPIDLTDTPESTPPTSTDLTEEEGTSTALPPKKSCRRKTKPEWYPTTELERTHFRPDWANNMTEQDVAKDKDWHNRQYRENLSKQIRAINAVHKAKGEGSNRQATEAAKKPRKAKRNELKRSRTQQAVTEPTEMTGVTTEEDIGYDAGNEEDLDQLGDMLVEALEKDQEVTVEDNPMCDAANEEQLNELADMLVDALDRDEGVTTEARGQSEDMLVDEPRVTNEVAMEEAPKHNIATAEEDAGNSDIIVDEPDTMEGVALERKSQAELDQELEDEFMAQCYEMEDIAVEEKVNSEAMVVDGPKGTEEVATAETGTVEEDADVDALFED